MTGTAAIQVFDAMSADDRLAVRAKAQGIADQFEELFVKELMAGFRKTATVTGEGGGLFGTGPGADTYSEWFDDNLADHLASHGRLGVTDTLMHEFERWKQIPAAPRPEELGPTISVIAPGGFDVTA